MLHACDIRFVVIENLKKKLELPKIQKLFKLLRHIKSYGTYIEH